MSVDRTAIEFTVSCEGKSYPIITYKHEYRSLMLLIYDKIYLEDFGDCKGIGRCGTCHVHIVDYQGDLLKRVGNESNTFGKMPQVQRNSRLSCLILIDDRIQGLHFHVVHDGDLGLY